MMMARNLLDHTPTTVLAASRLNINRVAARGAFYRGSPPPRPGREHPHRASECTRMLEVAGGDSGGTDNGGGKKYRSRNGLIRHIIDQLIVVLIFCRLTVCVCSAQPVFQGGFDDQQIDSALRSSDRVACVRVLDMTVLPLSDTRMDERSGDASGLLLATLRVDSFLLGYERETELFALVGRVREGSEGLAVGDKAVVFLARANTYTLGLSHGIRELVVNASRGRKLWTVVPGGAWRRDRDGDGIGLVEDPLGAKGAERGPVSSVMARDWEDFLYFTGFVLDTIYPRLDARLIANGTPSFNCRLFSDGHAVGEGPTRIHPADAAKMWATIREERFWTLPLLVGNTGGPDTPALQIVITTRRDEKKVNIALGGQDVGDRIGSEIDIQRARRIWESIPIPTKPELR